MAYAPVTATGDGAEDEFTINFSYLQRDHVKALVDGSAATFTWVDEETIKFDSAPGNGDAVVIYRDSSANSLLPDFATGANLSGTDIDFSAMQAFFMAEEAKVVTDPPEVTGIHASNTALVSLLSALESLGLIVDSTTAA